MDYPAKIDFSECAFFLNNEYMGVTLGDGEFEFTGEPEKFVDCRADAAAWANIEKASMRCRATIADSAMETALFPDSAFSLPSAGGDLLGNAAMLIVMPLNGEFAYSFPKAVFNLKFSYLWKQGFPAALKVEFMMFPDENRVLMRRIRVSEELGNKLPSRLNLACKTMENDILDIIKQAGLDAGYEWTGGDDPELAGVKVQLTGENPCRHPYMREMTFEAEISVFSYARLYTAAGAVTAKLPVSNTGNIYRTELAGWEIVPGKQPHVAVIKIKAWFRR